MPVASALLLASFAALFYGADIFVKGASSLARKLGVSTLGIGLTVVAVATSVPELVVNLASAARGSTELAFGNIFGSNVANILLVLGMAAVIRPVVVRRETIWKQIPFSILAVLILFVFAAIPFQRTLGVVSRLDGLALAGLGVAFLLTTFRTDRKNGMGGRIAEERPLMRTLAYLVAGMASMIVGGTVIVDSAVTLARGFGVAEHWIGLTVVALGTSLPELATSVAAAQRGQTDVALGNVVGSNIINILFILGLTAAVSPLPVSAASVQDGLFVCLVSLLLFLFMFVGTRHRLDRWQGAAFLWLYVAFVVATAGR